MDEDQSSMNQQHQRISPASPSPHNLIVRNDALSITCFLEMAPQPIRTNGHMKSRYSNLALLSKCWEGGVQYITAIGLNFQEAVACNGSLGRSVPAIPAYALARAPGPNQNHYSTLNNDF